MELFKLIDYRNSLHHLGHKRRASMVMNQIHNIVSNISLEHIHNVEIVVARYNENLDWLLPYSKFVIVYNKGQPLTNGSTFKSIINIENVGRESHTYLYHIINNWNNLAENTLFIQGNIDDHDNILPIKLYLLSNISMCINLSSNKLDIINWNRLNYNNKWKEMIRNKPWKYSKYTFGEWWDIYLQKPKPKSNNFKWSPGGIFSIKQELIKKHPLEYYQKLITTIDNHINPEEGHYFERSWYYLFN